MWDLRSTLDKLKGIKPDLVRENEGWQEWDYKGLLKDIKRWTEINPVEENITLKENQHSPLHVNVIFCWLRHERGRKCLLTHCGRTRESWEAGQATFCCCLAMAWPVFLIFVVACAAPSQQCVRNEHRARLFTTPNRESSKNHGPEISASIVTEVIKRRIAQI